MALIETGERMRVLLLMPVVMSIGCSGAQKVSESSRVTTLAQAREDYLAGLKALADGDYTTATDLLQKVSRGPSYIVYSPLAKLRLADAYFFQEKYDEAAEAYRAFMETNAGDPNLHYAWFMMAKSRVKGLPAEFFLIPPADRRDQRKVRAAMDALNQFLRDFPDSPYVEEAIRLLQQMVNVVTSYEMEVARFYMSRDKPAGAVNRLRRLVAEVPRAGALEETRAALIHALAKNMDGEALRQECEYYMGRFPAGKHRSEVQRWCAMAPPAGN